MSGVWAVVPAAGSGQRACQNGNKVFVKIAGRFVLVRTLEALITSGVFDGIVVVLSRSDMDNWHIAESDLPAPCVCVVAEGGATRAASVYNGLKLVPADAEIVAVHDAARPFITPGGINAAVDSAREYGSGILCAPVTDTIKICDEDSLVSGTPDRSTLRAAQTPQAFRYADIMKAYESAARDGYLSTDDSALYEKYIGPARLVTCADAVSNKKLTYPGDFTEAERRLSMPRIGTGFDAHRLVEGRKLILCGVDIPYEKGLDGHSDADVAVHALMDAMLGAAALEDIGHQFPDSDMQYKGISSMLLLKKTCDIIKNAGYSVGNCDITIVAQRPKMASFRDAMRENIASTIGIDISNVNVKATTTEHMGYEGRGEGISAQAVVMLV